MLVWIERAKFLPRPAIENGISKIEFARAVSVRRNCDFDAGHRSEASIFSRQIESVRARLDLKEAAILFRVGDDPLNVNLIPRTLQKQSSRGAAHDGEIPVAHGPQNSSVCAILPRPNRE